MSARLVRDFFGINSFLGGHFGGHHFPPEDLSPIALYRFYIQNSDIARELDPITGKLRHTFQPTWKMWEYDNSLSAHRALGHRIMLATQGGFPFQDNKGRGGSILWSAPVNTTDNLMDPATYHYAGRVVYNLAARYGRNTNAIIDPQEIATNYIRNKIKVGLDYADYISVQQEWDNGATRPPVILNAAQYAVMLKLCYDAIKSADPSMQVVMGATMHADVVKGNQNLDVIRAYAALNGGHFPDDIIFDFHHYMNNGYFEQKRTRGIIPNHPLAGANKVSNITLWGDSLGRPWMCSESGYDRAPLSIQSVPSLPGKSADASKGILLVQMALWYACAENCHSFCAYEIRNERDDNPPGLYATCGIYNRYEPTPYNPTDAVPVINEFLDKMGDCMLPLQMTMHKAPYRVVGEKLNGQRITAEWDDDSAVTYHNN